MRLGLIGEDIMHSSSPDLHVRLGDLIEEPSSYDLFDAAEMPGLTLEKQVRKLVKEGYRGVNVTYPFKEQAAALADEISDGVRMIGSSNTLIFNSEHVRAENTDFSGFISGFKATLGERQPGRVLQVGSGGVGKAVAFALGQLGAREIVLADLDQSKSRALAEELNSFGFNASSIGMDAIGNIIPQCDGLVNCTPVGHEKSPGLPLPADLITPQHWVFDAVYVPALTELVQAAKAAKATVMTGVSLFVFQGVDAFKLFCQSDDQRHRVDEQTDTLFAHYKHLLLK